MKRILLDTNAYTALMLGNDEILNFLSVSEIIYISIFVMAELLAGFKGGEKESDNCKIFETFLKKPGVKILNGTKETAQVFAFIKNSLKKKGLPIPINDVWIASHTIESGSILISCDKHFDSVDGLRLIKFLNLHK
ncbi:MAG: type II toxin-antitoxin system VapC family toxin [Desulfobacula sp.]|nr:type II toxin-antitoxin system VapC family toxin [Desulfobacula sp.]